MQGATFEIKGSSELLLVDTDLIGKESFHETLARLIKVTPEIEIELISKLQDHLGNIQLRAVLAFSPGSITWAGFLISSNASTLWHAISSIGGPAEFAALVAATLNTILIARLPGRISPKTTCLLKSAPTATKLNYNVGLVKASLDQLILSILKFFVVQTKYALRKIRNLPYLITGTNPYAFSKQGGIAQTIYSKLTVRLFGWASVFVVLYVTVASQKIFKELGIFAGSKLAEVLFSAMAGIIVFYSDRFILSFPKVTYKISYALRELAISQLTGFAAIRMRANNQVLKFFSFDWLKSLILSIFRVFLALVISGLLVSTMIISVNEETIKENLVFIKDRTASSLIADTPSYKKYQSLVQAERRAYFNAEANKICRLVAARGVQRPEDNFVKADERTLSGAFGGAFGVSIGQSPPDYDCGVKRVAPCASASPACPEYGRIIRDQALLDQNFQRTRAERVTSENEVRTSFESARNRLPSTTDFSMKIQALAIIYREKLNSGTLWYEMFNIGPFLVILLIFELIPAFAKIFFPASAYDHLVAKEDFYHQLSAHVPRTQAISDLLAKHFDAAPDATSISRLRDLDELEKEKDDELKAALEYVLDCMTGFFQSLVATLGIALTSVLALIVVAGFLLIVAGSLMRVGEFLSPLFDVSAFIEMLKKVTGR